MRRPVLCASCAAVTILCVMTPGFRIGSLSMDGRVVAAPMAGISDAPCRYIARRMGAGLTVTEMASAKGLIQGDRRTFDIIKTHPAARPYCVQIFGNNESDMARGAAIAEEFGADAIDINMGCPIRKVVKSRCGGAMLKDISLAGRIIASVRNSIKVPLTVKMRIGWNEHSPVVHDLAKLAASEGADAITVHPRFVNDGFSGKARWNIIGEVQASIDIPVIGNGDIESAQDAVEMMRTTGCAAVMVGRAAMGNPFIYREIDAALEGRPAPQPPTPEEKYDTAIEQFELMFEYLPHRVAVFLWRKHLCWYARGLPMATEFRRKVFEIEDPDRLRELAAKFFLNGAEGERS